MAPLGPQQIWALGASYSPHGPRTAAYGPHGPRTARPQITPKARKGQKTSIFKKRPKMAMNQNFTQNTKDPRKGQNWPWITCHPKALRTQTKGQNGHKFKNPQDHP
ncbi:hypothetical protein O181_132661 [Austropuccinia psidii MF-1]|uniref:Uncharacterized protein n=1 Tax=Austropuccinia psidii MF-1 TaxID=1389203 RepID=A0A9Q3L6R8_9BASI|nr:hypothetical protein [Austropuccinia psidii MF-1]